MGNTSTREDDDEVSAREDSPLIGSSRKDKKKDKKKSKKRAGDAEAQYGTNNGEGSSQGGFAASRRNVKNAGQWLVNHGIIALLVFLLGVAIIALSVFFGMRRTRTENQSNVCLTPGCVHASSSILENLSPKEIDPCTDFSEFVCGGWKEKHDMRADQGDIFEGTLMSERSLQLLRHVLEGSYDDLQSSSHSAFSPASLQAQTADTDRDNFQKMKDAYDACMSEDIIEQRGAEPLRDLLREIPNIYPTSGNGVPHKSPKKGIDDGLTETIVYLAKLGIPALIEFGVGADDKNPDQTTLMLSNPSTIGLPAKDYYKDEKVLQRYTEAIETTLSSLSKNLLLINPDITYPSIAQEVVDFEKKLSSASMDEEDASDVTKYYNPKPLSEVQSLLPQVNFKTLFSRLSPDYMPNRIIVSSPEYLQKLDNILKNTTRETLQRYFFWKTIEAYASIVDRKEVKAVVEFRNVLQGKDPNAIPERWQTCVRTVDSDLSWILGRFFIEKAFSAKAKELGDRIVHDIKEQFIVKLNKVEWMDDEVKKLAIQKVNNIIQKIGYPTASPDITNPSELEKYYSAIEISPKKFFENSVAVTKFEVGREWAKLGKPTNRDEWDMSPPTVNAYYNPPGNEIVFPAGIMQFPVFGLDSPEYLSYGAFASVAGHELSHAFDSTGRHYDQIGNYTDWWNNATVVGFEERAQCFVDQYSEFSVEGPDGKPLHVNGKLTLGENIADAGGVNAAFAAWTKRDQENPNPTLPGLDRFTKKQLFFVSYGSWWCGKSRKEAAISRIRTDPHSPLFARILGTMANSPDFLEAFSCPKKEAKCALW